MKSTNHYFVVSLWFILVFPWQYFNVPAIRIIEPIILFSLLFFIYKNKGKITYETFCKIYFALISIGLIYTFGFPLFRNSDLLNIGHRIHLFLFMAEIFLVYLIIYNLVDNKKLKLKKLFDNFFFIHLFIAAIYIYVGVSVQAGSMAVNRIAYSAAPDMTGGGNFYISNGVPWIFMIQNSIILGYFIKHDKSIINLIRLILLSILPIIISYLNMSRSAIIFSSLITILALSQIFLQDLFNRRFFTIKHFIKQLIFITAFSLLLIQITIQYNKQNLLIKYIEYSIGSKGDTKNIRLGLVNESIRYGFETYLIGGGIGYLDLDKDKLNNSYKFLKRNSPQNTFASIFAELGIVGIILFCSMFIIIIKRLIHYNFQLTTINNSIMLAMKYSILAILLSFLFHHSAERSFPMFGPFVIITAIFNRLYINNTNKYFERSYK